MADRGIPEPVEIAAVARGQCGLVTWEQFSALGISRDVLRQRVASGALVRLAANVYAVAGSPSTWERAAMAACLDRGPAAVLSHHTAARAWGIPCPRSPGIHVTVPFGATSRVRRADVVVHRTRSLGSFDRTRIGRLPVTSAARTLVDLAPAVGEAALRSAVDEVLSRRLLTPDRLLRAVERLAPPRRGHTQALVAAVEPWMGSRPLDSVAEARFLRAILAAGLPEPEIQRVVDDEDGRVGRVDFIWPAQGFVLEVDGFRWHANPEAHAKDSERTLRLTAAGLTVVRATPTDLERTPARVLDALARCLALPA